ncbi:hypothetical protein SAMN04487980_10561, partial [Streptomyces sp. cf124]|uniref:hypothetical protein n=3 Tax=unclassified Streptomyces TaxID=2593676 RepID=UPI0008E37FF7
AALAAVGGLMGGARCTIGGGLVGASGCARGAAALAVAGRFACLAALAVARGLASVAGFTRVSGGFTCPAVGFARVVGSLTYPVAGIARISGGLACPVAGIACGPGSLTYPVARFVCAAVGYGLFATGFADAVRLACAVVRFAGGIGGVWFVGGGVGCLVRGRRLFVSGIGRRRLAARGGLGSRGLRGVVLLGRSSVGRGCGIAPGLGPSCRCGGVTVLGTVPGPRLRGR